MDPIMGIIAFLSCCGCPSALIISALFVLIVAYRRYSAAEDERLAKEQFEIVAEKLSRSRESPKTPDTPVRKEPQQAVGITKRPSRRQPQQQPAPKPAEVTPHGWDPLDEQQVEEQRTTMMERPTAVPEDFGTTPRTGERPVDSEDKPTDQDQPAIIGNGYDEAEPGEIEVPVAPSKPFDNMFKHRGGR